MMKSLLLVLACFFRTGERAVSSASSRHPQLDLLSNFFFFRVKSSSRGGPWTARDFFFLWLNFSRR